MIMSLISGMLMAIQGVFNTKVTEMSSTWAAAGFVQITAFLTCVVAYFVTGRGNVAGIAEVRPLYLLSGGVIGAFITITVIAGMGSIGPAKSTMLIVIAQLVTAWLVELLGIFLVEKADFSWRKLLGLLIAVVGVVIFEWEKAN